MEPPANTRSDLRHLSVGQPDFPACLAAIPQPASEVWIRGRLPPAPRVALVGARRSDVYGLELARSLAVGLSQAGLAVVSGGAAGVDTAALQGCLEAGGRPVAVLGTGLDLAYPSSNRALFERVAERGVLLSEYPPGTPGLPAHFPKRNRLISALADGVVVVRAALNSGSLITARLAARQGRKVLAVPGPAGEALSAGAHLLLRQGAVLVEQAADVLAALGLSNGTQTRLDLAAPGPHPAAALLEPVELSGPEGQVFGVLGAEGLPVDLIAERCGLPVGQVSAILLGLELKGLVAQKVGMRYARIEGQAG